MATFTPGFRINGLDIAVLAVGVVGSVTMASYRLDSWVIVASAVFMFFCFCNVFRIRRPAETLWAVAYVIAISYALLRGQSLWMWSVIMIAASAPLIIYECRAPSYHGIGWRLVNPGLEHWFTQHHPPKQHAAPPAYDQAALTGAGIKEPDDYGDQ